MPADRHARLHGPPQPIGEVPSAPDVRSPAQHDRDRVLYTSAFRRLAGVTQVVGAVEGHAFHNRLTHTLEVAQIARRMAERFGIQYADELRKYAVTLEPEVAEAAALAHDLGHPPFGHVAERELDELALNEGSPDGYEGNAQSFRIITRLAAHRPLYRGLNLTRATLNAVLKYPWMKGDGDVAKPKKFGAYRSEATDSAFARDGSVGQARSLEAQIMDHADAVAYSVHDLDDFYRVGLVPLAEVKLSFGAQLRRLVQGGKVKEEDVIRHEKGLGDWFSFFPYGRYEGTYKQRTALRALGAQLINELVMEPSLAFEEDVPILAVPTVVELKMRFLQSLVWTYVIQSPRLASQQRGQRQIIAELFRVYRDVTQDPAEAQRIAPGAFRLELDKLDEVPSDGFPTRSARVARLAADIVASFTDSQAVLMFHRLTGHDPGSVTDLLEG